MKTGGLSSRAFNLLLRLFLPVLQPAVLKWALLLADEISVSGLPLDDEGFAIAKLTGVRNPEKIRIGYVDRLPLPDNLILRMIAVRTGMLNPRTVGLTLGYSVLIQEGRDSVKLRLHEFRHVHQYEAAGSITEFLPRYLKQIILFGYWWAPFEVDARAYEIYEEKTGSPAASTS